MTQTDYNAAVISLDRLQRLRASGVLSQTVDGTTTTFRSWGELDAEISRLKRELSIHDGITPPHPYAREAF